MKKLFLFILCLSGLTGITRAQIFTVPYTDDFESGAPGWTTFPTGQPANNSWELGFPSFGQTNSCHSGNYCYDINLDTSYFNSGTALLMSPTFNFSNLAGIKISFWQNLNVEYLWDGFRMEYSTDSTMPWNSVGSVNAIGSINWYNDSSLNSFFLPAWTGNTNGWIKSSIVLPNFSGTSDVRFRFVFTCDASVILDGVSIDDFAIEIINVNSVTGTVYIDANNNSVIDSSDLPAQNLMMNALPNGGYFYLPTDSNGNYTFLVDSGVTTTITPVLPLYATVSPATYILTINGINQVSASNDFLLSYLPGVIDPEISISSTPVRPGLTHNKILHLTNLGTTFVSGTVSLNYDSAYTFLSASSPSTVISAQQIEFAYSGLFPGENRFITCTFLADSTLIAGTITSASAIIYPVVGDTNNVNNYDTVQTVTVNSFDPNNKLIDPEGDITLLQVATGIDLNYTINFQNTGTAPALNISIFDMIAPNSDLSTFEITGSSHALTSWNIGSNRQAQFSFETINLADSVSNEPASHGFVSYKIRPFNNLATGTQINNFAAIVFDNNIPVITNTVTTTVIDPTGLAVPVTDNKALIFPNPNSGKFYLKTDQDYHSYAIFNSLGQNILSGKIKQPGHTEEIVLSSLNSGLYVIVVTGINETQTATMIIE